MTPQKKDTKAKPPSSKITAMDLRLNTAALRIPKWALWMLPLTTLHCRHSLQHLHQPRLQERLRVVLLFSEAQLGLVDTHISPSGRAKCHICNLVLEKGELRGSWAWSRTKPHRYIHGSCIGRIDGERARRALPVIVASMAEHAHDLFQAPLLARIYE